MLLVGAAACAPGRSYVFHPAEQATATVEGRPAAHYGIPPEAPRGSARVASFGVTTIEDGEEEVPTLHARLIVANNNGAGPFVLDTRALRAAIAGGAPVGPAFIDRHGEDDEIAVQPGGEATVDAYFALPEGTTGARGVPRFDLIWEVDTPGRTVVERTPFERITVQPVLPARLSFGVGMGIGPTLYDPFLAPAPVIVIERRTRVFAPPPRR